MSFPPVDARCWFLTGPTACGKSALGLALAERLDAEILSLDSMAVYRGMDIGTAKPTADDLRRVPHHLIDLVDPSAEFSIADYVAAAHAAVAEIHARGKVALFVGGTPLYLKALLRGLFVGPAADWKFRRQMEEVANGQSNAFLHKQLAVVDPVSAARLHPNNLRRVIRALEVYEQTGTPISTLQSQFEQARPAGACRCFVLDRPRESLVARIDARVHAMFVAGLVQETQALVGRYELSRTARQAVGYCEVIEHFRGEHDLPTAIELVKQHTRQFAKRQLTWFRSLSECRTIAACDDLTENVEQIAAAGRVLEIEAG